MRAQLKITATVLALCGALVLSGCGSEKEPPAVAATPGSPLPSPSWTPPPAGMWTESDLAVGREVPPEEMDRLRPLPRVPEEPETITHNTEQGAKDAALYFAQVVFASVAHADAAAMAPVLYEYCENCADVYETVKRMESRPERYRARSPEYSVAECEAGTGDVPFYVVGLNLKRYANLEVDSTTGIIKTEFGNQQDVRWSTVQYIDGKWRPFSINLNEKPNYEE